ncbi:MAG: hypothetical protein HC789_18470 [Microcoleus sp. CSU_2_2]|nr:hypothetical protein [Microcoleus sp. SU_5_3]NJS12213.1 hypothetical protein [Microcoleus sp. CSU_2_2]
MAKPCVFLWWRTVLRSSEGFTEAQHPLWIKETLSLLPISLSPLRVSEEGGKSPELGEDAIGNGGV